MSAQVGRYQLGETVRLLTIEREGHALRLIDRGTNGEATAYVVEPDVAMDDGASLAALVADYVRQAERLGEVPMSRRAALPQPAARIA